MGTTCDGFSTTALDGKYTSTNQETLADDAEAWLVRTKTGVTLRYHWWLDSAWAELGVSASTCGFSRIRRVLALLVLRATRDRTKPQGEDGLSPGMGQKRQNDTRDTNTKA